MKRQNVLVVLVVVASVVALVYYFFIFDKPKESQVIVEETGPKTLSVEDSIEDSFNLEIPENIERAELQDVTGQGIEGLATRDFSDNTYTMTILADLPEGNYYAALVRGQKGEDDFQVLPVGNLVIAKGGYLVNYQSSSDLTEFQRVIVATKPITSEIPDDLVFDGSF